jgi:hypothetical protein
MELGNWSSPTNNAGIQNASIPMNADPNWWRIHCDGTNFNFDVSADGYSWLTTYTVATGSNYLTPNRVGFFIEGLNNNQMAAGILSWSVG